MTEERKQRLEGGIFTLLSSIRAIKNAARLSFEEELYVVWGAMSQWSQAMIHLPKQSPKEDLSMKKKKKKKERPEKALQRGFPLYSAGYEDLKFAGMNMSLQDMLDSIPPRGDNEKAYIYRHNPDDTTDKIYKWRKGKWRPIPQED